MVGSYLEKTVENAASDWFESNFNGAAFCLSHQLVGFLLKYTLESCTVVSLFNLVGHIGTTRSACCVMLFIVHHHFVFLSASNPHWSSIVILTKHSPHQHIPYLVIHSWTVKPCGGPSEWETYNIPRHGHLRTLSRVYNGSLLNVVTYCFV